jgi:hypothetical protein
MQIYEQLIIGTILHRKIKKRELLIIGILSINLHIKAMASNIIGVNHTIGAGKSNSGN